MNRMGVLTLFVMVVAVQAKMLPNPGHLLGPRETRTEGLKDDPTTKEVVTRSMEEIETAHSNIGSGEVEQHIPSPIKIAECHVEFKVTKKVPGRCIKLAGTIPACQSQKYLGINYNECN